MIEIEKPAELDNAKIVNGPRRRIYIKALAREKAKKSTSVEICELEDGESSNKKALGGDIEAKMSNSLKMAVVAGQIATREL